MEPSNPTHEHRAQLARALRPQNVGEHTLVDYLAAVVREQHPTFVQVLERRVRTAARAARMHVAQLALDHWQPDVASPPDAVATMEHYASGGDPAAGIEPEQMAASAAEYQRGFGAGIEHARRLASEHEDVPTAIALAYDRGWREAVQHCREQQLRGLDPELWDTGRGEDQ